MTRPQLNRRTALKGLAGITGLGVAGGAGLLYTTGPSTATVTIGNDVEVATDDGDLSFVDFDIDTFKAGWEGFDVPVAAIAFRDRVSLQGDGQGFTTIFDQRGVDQQPVLLTEISSKGNGGDGWGGADEYASTFDTKTALDFTSLNRPGVDGPAEGTAGWVAAGVGWRLLTDDMGEHGPRSIETPAIIGDDVGEMDNPDDGTTDVHTVEFEKRVYLYGSEDNGNAGISTQNGTTVYPLGTGGADDGTLEYVEATPTFQVEVVNEPTESATSGDGTVSGG